MKNKSITALILIFCIQISTQNPLLLTNVNATNFDYKVYYSDKLKQNTVLKWKIDKFDVTGMTTYSELKDGSIIELKLINSTQYYNVREFGNYTNPNNFFKIYIDNKNFSLLDGNWDIGFNFYSSWISWQDESGAYNDVVEGISLNFLYSTQINYSDGTNINRFDFEKNLFYPADNITDNYVNKSLVGGFVEIQKDTGIVTKYKIKFDHNYQLAGERITVDIEYELIESWIPASVSIPSATTSGFQTELIVVVFFQIGFIKLFKKVKR